MESSTFHMIHRFAHCQVKALIILPFCLVKRPVPCLYIKGTWSCFFPHDEVQEVKRPLAAQGKHLHTSKAIGKDILTGQLGNAAIKRMKGILVSSVLKKGIAATQGLVPIKRSFLYGDSHFRSRLRTLI